MKHRPSGVQSAGMQGEPLSNKDYGGTSYIGDGDPGAVGGGTYTEPSSKATIPTLQDYENIFGPAGRDVKLDMQRNKRHARWHLPDALRGYNLFLTDRIDGLITDTTSSPFTSIILPYKYIENVDQKIKWNSWSFDEGLASRVPYESAARTLTQTKRSYAGYTVRHGLAITMEHNFMMSEKGRQNFYHQLQQVVGSIQYTNDIDVHIALITAPSYAKQRAERYYTSSKTNHQVIREYVDLFGFMAKNPNAMDIMIEETKSMMKLWGSPEPTFLLTNSKLTFQMTMNPDKTQYITQGVDGIKRLKNGPNIPTYRGLNVINSRAFEMETGAPPRDVLRRRVRVAEYYRIPWEKGVEEKSFMFYDESKDSFQKFTWNQLRSMARTSTAAANNNTRPNEWEILDKVFEFPAGSGYFLSMSLADYTRFFVTERQDMNLAEGYRYLFFDHVTALAQNERDAEIQSVWGGLDAFFRAFKSYLFEPSERLRLSKEQANFFSTNVRMTPNETETEADSARALLDDVLGRIFGEDRPSIRIDMKSSEKIELVIIRPNIEHNMLGIILGRGGIDELGATLWGQTELSCYDDSMHGIWGMSYKYNERAIVFNEKNLVRLWDVGYDGYNGGKDCTAVDWKSDASVSQFRDQTYDLNQPYEGVSMMVMAFDVGMDSTHEPWPSPIVFYDDNFNKDRFPIDGEHVHNVKVEPFRVFNRPEYAYTYKDYFARMPEFSRMHNSKNAGSAAEENETSSSMFAFQGTMKTFDKAFIAETTGNGHHGPDYVGVASVRSGKGLRPNLAGNWVNSSMI